MLSLDNNRHLLKVWLASNRASLVREMEFRGNFFIGLFRQFLWLSAFVFLIEIIFNNVSDLAGWSKYEVMVVLALSRVIEGVINVVFSDNVMGLTSKVQHGTFDFVLTKPLPTQFSAFFTRLSYQNIGNFLNGFILLGYIASQAPHFFTVPNILLTTFLALLGISIYYSLLVLVGSLVFRLERLEALWSFNVLFSEPLTTPFTVFPDGPRFILTYLLPIAFVVFVPAQALTDRLESWQLILAIIITAIFFSLANIAWKAGLKRYTSASS